MERSFEALEGVAERICADLEEPSPIQLTLEEEAAFRVATDCWIYEGELDVDSENPRVRDHDHITGAYRGAAHNNCNLMLKT